MKLYSQKSGASIKMVPDVRFLKVLKEIIQLENIQFVFESGTYLGTGSTSTLAKLFIDNEKIPADFITVEANLEYYKLAKKNLAKYDFIKPVFGLSVDYLEAVKFLVNDNIFNELESYPDVFIDHLETPQHFYLQEILIGLFQDKTEQQIKKTGTGIFAKKQNTIYNFRNNVASDFCTNRKDHTSLILLDSAAGIGFFEFLELKKQMGNNDYYIILDDIDHLKHFRSKEFIKKNPQDYKLIELDKEAGWLIAKFLPS